MYRMFCVSFKNYLEINDYTKSNDARLATAELIKILASIDVYEKLKSENNTILNELHNLVYQISINHDKFPVFKAFSWELEGYGFEKQYSSLFSMSIILEQLKLIDLLLSCHYWIAAS